MKEKKMRVEECFECDKGRREEGIVAGDVVALCVPQGPLTR
jgi:hypothetical protein